MDTEKASERDRLECILVPTDFSKPAAAALDWAIRIASAHGAKIRLVHTIDAPTAATVPSGLQQEIGECLASVEETVEHAGVRVESASYDLGKPWEVVAREVADAKADLIIVGAGGGRHVARLLGRTADRIIRTARVPVLTVHCEDPRKPTIRTVLVATDFSEEAALATSAAMRIVDTLPGKVRLVLLHVCYVPPVAEGVPWSGAYALPPEVEQEARRSLEALAGPLRSDRVEVEVRTRYGLPARIIEDEARDLDADLIAVGTLGRSGLSHLLLGSVAEHVLHKAPCPVLTVRRPTADQPVELAKERVGAVT